MATFRPAGYRDSTAFHPAVQPSCAALARDADTGRAGYWIARARPGGRSLNGPRRVDSQYPRLSDRRRDLDDAFHSQGAPEIGDLAGVDAVVKDRPRDEQPERE